MWLPSGGMGVGAAAAAGEAGARLTVSGGGGCERLGRAVWGRRGSFTPVMALLWLPAASRGDKFGEFACIFVKECGPMAVTEEGCRSPPGNIGRPAMSSLLSKPSESMALPCLCMLRCTWSFVFIDIKS